jgi:hypothetical protein
MTITGGRATRSQRAEAYLRLLVEAELRRAVAYQPFPADSCLTRVAEQAWALASVDAIDDATAEAVITDLRRAFVARGIGGEAFIKADRRFLIGPVRAERTWLRPRHIAIGVAAACKSKGQLLRLFFGTMTLDADCAELTLVATAGRPNGELHDALSQWVASDDLGRSYQVEMTGRSDDRRLDGILHFRPVPAEGFRWVDVTLQGSGTFRVNVEDAPPALPTTTATLAADTVVDRYVDALAIHMLWRVCGGEAAVHEPDAAAAVRGLVGAGVLAADGRALGRLAATASQSGLDLDVARLVPAPMPEPWLGMLRRRAAHDGRTGTVRPAGAVLPELDGARCLVTEIASAVDVATIRVQARGWPVPDYRWLMRRDRFYWTARDDRGGLYAIVTRGGGPGFQTEHFALELRPAIDPAARELQLILASKTGEVSVTVPLNWPDER